MLAGACQIVGPFIVLAQMSTLPSCPLHNTISSHHQAILASNPFGFDLMRYLRASSRKIITTANAKGRKMNSTGTPCARQPIPTSSFAPPASISAQVKHSLSFERLAARMGHRRRGTRIQRSQACPDITPLGRSKVERVGLKYEMASGPGRKQIAPLHQDEGEEVGGLGDADGFGVCVEIVRFGQVAI